MAKGSRNGKGAPAKRAVAPRPMNKPAMMDWALRLLRLLNERKVLNSRIVAEEFDVNIRTAQRYLLYLSDLPCVVVDEEKHTYSLTSDYVITDKILNTSEMALVCALIDYATHIFGKKHSDKDIADASPRTTLRILSIAMHAVPAPSSARTRSPSEEARSANAGFSRISCNREAARSAVYFFAGTTFPIPSLVMRAALSGWSKP
jgi:hypothetical protein